MATLAGPFARGRVAVLSALAVAWCATLSAQRLPEYQIKSAYLLGLARFVEWPAAASGPSFDICLLGDDPFGPWLDETTAGATVKNTPVVVRRLRHVDESVNCHAVYISASEASRLARVIDALRTRPVLTVSDLPQFAQKGGMIGFVMDGSRVRFVANPDAARAAGLLLTSELLRVAATVLGRPAPAE